ncbi:MAG TPA: NAD-dependent epimerase/dehydratase family protein [Candidatus Saccharimonadales bacterium]|nr:NAD-dependent epimerase/dehydratase family protein [Candidatus Saccharimonadales bacterium]
MQKTVLVTGSAGLIGSESVKFFCSLGFKVVGIDNNMRQYFFGTEASTDWNRQLLQDQFKDYIHYQADIRDPKAIDEIFSQHKFDLIIHTAAQPSHDWAAKEPLTDFSVNGTGTLIVLEAFKKYCPEAPFIFTSTNKVYGDTPNYLPLIELETRWEIDPSHKFVNGIDETMSIDSSKHSIFGVSKVAADVMVQEYGRYFGLQTVIFRGGCLTGPSHSATRLHGFLAYLIKCIAEGVPYTIMGYKGKQVRDNIHSSDLISAFYEFYQNPRSAEVYNMGGSRFSNISMMEAIEKIEGVLGRKGDITYVDKNREGDHIWYVSDVAKFQKHYPKWEYKYDIDTIIQEICEMGHFSKPTLIGSSVVSEINSSAGKKVFVSSHVTEVGGHVQALKGYLIKRFPRFVFIEHPFTYSNVADSQVGEYRASLPSFTTQKEKSENELVSYGKSFFLTIYWFLKMARGSDLFIGVNNLNALAGVLLKKLGYKFKLIYYCIDLSTNRFKNPILNSIYHYIDNVCVANADYIWSTSERAQIVRKTEVSSDSKNMLVPAGVNLEKILTPLQNKDINTLVVADHLTEQKGIQLVINCFDKILQLNPKARLVIYGTGPYEMDLKKLVEEKKLAKVVEFKGSINSELYSKLLSSYGVGIATYLDTDNTVFFSDPISVKEYLAAGLPVIATDYLWLAKEIDVRKMGKSIQYSEDQLLTALSELWSDTTFYNNASAAAQKYVSNLAWLDLFDKAFKHIGYLKTGIEDMSIAIVTHEFFKGSGQELKDFLIKNKVNMIRYVAHIFFYAKDSYSYVEDYESGKLIKKTKSIKLPKNEFLYYFRDAFYTLKFFLLSDKKFDLYVGVNSFNAMFGILLKKLGKVDKVVFFTIDYVMEKRFKNEFLNKLYVKMDRLAFFGSDYTWNVSDRMSKQRILELGESAKEKSQIVVPIGVPIEDAEKVEVARKDNVLVYSGGLNPEFGLEMILESMPTLIKKFPDIELRIIGSGQIDAKLRQMAIDLNIQKNVNFVGHIDTTKDRVRWLKLLKESTIGLATYEDSATTYKRFSDVTKPKDYMSCGLPIIVTSVIPISEDVKKFNLGRVVEYNSASFITAISDLLGDSSERKIIQDNVTNYSKNKSWESIFIETFHTMQLN